MTCELAQPAEGAVYKMIKLIDVSSAQSPSAIDPVKVRNSGVRGVYIRCGEGRDGPPDPARDAHVRKFEQTDMRIGFYYVLAPSNKDPVGAAAKANQLSQSSVQNELPFVIDIERNRPLGADAKVWADYLNKFLPHINGKYVCYTYTSFRKELEAVGFSTDKWFQAQYPPLRYPTTLSDQLKTNVLNHMAAYNAALAKNDAATAHKEMVAMNIDAIALSKLGQEPAPIGSPPAAKMWQWGGSANAATVPGVLGLCDRSWFLGNEDEWAAFMRYPPVVQATQVVIQKPT